VSLVPQGILGLIGALTVALAVSSCGVDSGPVTHPVLVNHQHCLVVSHGSGSRAIPEGLYCLQEERR
jgi:hypothetical protein